VCVCVCMCVCVSWFRNCEEVLEAADDRCCTGRHGRGRWSAER